MSRKLLLAAVLLTSIALCLFATRENSATDDEPAHVASGFLKVTKGRFDFYNEQPPLVNSISALPLALGS